MRKIRARTSLLTCLPAPTRLALETHAQYKRKPARCQLTSVLGVTRNERLRPPRPEPSQRDPEQLVQRRESTARSGGVKSQQLLTEGEIFENEILPRTESTDNPAQEI